MCIFTGAAVRIARLAIPVLPFALVRWQPERASIGKMKPLINIEDRLHDIVAYWKCRKIFDGIAD